MDVIRLIKHSDYPLIAYIWSLAGQTIKPREVYPHQTSYVFEREGKLLYLVAVYPVDGMPIAYVEALIRDPQQPSDFKAITALQAHLEAQMKARGVTRIFGLANNEGLAKHYGTLGYNRLGSLVVTSKEI